MSDNDHYQLMHLTQMVCASIPAMEEDEEVRQVLSGMVDAIQEDLKDEAPSKVLDVQENVINVKFN